MLVFLDFSSTFDFFRLTCPVGVRWSLCLSWLSGVAGSERALGLVAPDSAWPATGLDTPLPSGALETLASVPGCGESDSLSADWKGPWRPLD